MRRNPHAPANALTLEGIKPGLEVVVIGGRSPRHHSRMTILSEPYPFACKLTDPQRPGWSRDVVNYAVRVRHAGMRKDLEAFLPDIGVVPRSRREWALNYTVAAADYRPADYR